MQAPTRSRGMSRSSLPCFKNMLPADCEGFMPIPSLVMIAEVAAGTCKKQWQNINCDSKSILAAHVKTLLLFLF